MFYAKEIKHPSMSSRGGEHIFFTLSCGPGWLIGITIWNIKELRFMRKCVPLTPFTGKPACFPLSSQSGWNKVLIWLPHPL